MDVYEQLKALYAARPFIYAKRYFSRQTTQNEKKKVNESFNS